MNEIGPNMEIGQQVGKRADPSRSNHLQLQTPCSMMMMMMIDDVVTVTADYLSRPSPRIVTMHVTIDKRSSIESL